MMKKNITYFLLFGFFVLFRFSLIAQNPDIKRTYHWYFGDKVGLDFSSGNPVAVTNGQMSVWKGCASVSDTTGNLLFYYNGNKIWNKNQQIMPNGTQLNTLQSIPSTQLLAVPLPGNENIYYVFTLQYDSTNITSQWIYAIVDMTQQGGLGDIISKGNVLTIPNTPNEKITGIKHQNGTDIWIIVTKFQTNRFYSYLLTNSGISATPIISSVGLPDNEQLGELKASFDGTKLAVALSSNNIEILDFDKTTGIVSNPTTFPQLPNTPSKSSDAYGLEFSSDGKKLYVSYLWFIVNGNDTTANTIYQIHLTGDSASTVNSLTLLDTTSIIFNSTTVNGIYDYTFSMQVGSDGKIYTTKATTYHLGAIMQPNILGIGCTNVDSIIFLNGKKCQNGFPNYLRDYFYVDSLYNSSVKDEEGNTIINIYPNPFSEYTTIDISQANFSSAIFILHNIFGNEVLKSEIRDSKFQIRRNSLSNGIYFLQIKTNKKTYSQKLIITN